MYEMTTHVRSSIYLQAAEVAAKNTQSMKAKAGRASYVSADVLTKPDPGATAVAVWLRAVCDVLVK